MVLMMPSLLSVGVVIHCCEVVVSSASGVDGVCVRTAVGCVRRL